MSVAAEARTDGWRAWLQGPVAAMLFLGFSSGLPLLLVFSTLSRWLSEAGLSRETIAQASAVMLVYAVKFFWSPLLDHVRIPLLGRKLGDRRAWMLLGQVVVAIALVGIAMHDPTTSFESMIGWMWVLAIASATQDMAVDAYRIERVPPSLQALAAASYTFGYRAAMVVGTAGALYVAEFWNWHVAYFSMAACALVGIVTTFVIREPLDRVDRSFTQLPPSVSALALGTSLPSWLRRGWEWLLVAIVAPFADFARRYGWLVLVILAMLLTYRLTDTLLSVMTQPFYAEEGFSKPQVANVTKIFGLVVTLAGAFVGGITVVRWGLWKPLLAGAIIAAASNLIFAGMVGRGANEAWLLAAICADNFGNGMAGTVFIALLSRLCDREHSATQYALLSSIVQVVGRWLGTKTGAFVDVNGYFAFFMGTAVMGIPALVLCIVLWRLDATGRIRWPAATPVLPGDLPAAKPDEASEKRA